jgi:hypothetical protein
MFFSFSGFEGDKMSGCYNFCDRINDPVDFSASVAVLPPVAAARVARGNELEAARFAHVKAALVAVGRRDAAAFNAHLAALALGECVIKFRSSSQRAGKQLSSRTYI